MRQIDDVQRPGMRSGKISFRLPKYRIIKVKGVCPWQLQERAWLIFWRDKFGSFSSIRTVEKELRALELEERRKAVLANRHT